jgi:hypothetical protein
MISRAFASWDRSRPFANPAAVGDDDVVETVPERARKILQYLLEDDLPVQSFYDDYWKKQPIHIASQRRDRFDGFLSPECFVTTGTLEWLMLCARNIFGELTRIKTIVITGANRRIGLAAAKLLLLLVSHDQQVEWCQYRLVVVCRTQAKADWAAEQVRRVASGKADWAAEQVRRVASGVTAKPHRQQHAIIPLA